MGLDNMITFNDLVKSLGLTYEIVDGKLVFKNEEEYMCEKCENYKPPKVEQAKMDCFKNKCAECKCKACADFAECDNKKCYSCKFHNNMWWSSGSAQTATWNPISYGYDGRGNNVL